MKAEYGVNGMVEWVALIPARRNIVRVRFRGGRQSEYGYGTTPATFTTDNPAVASLIEGSRYFASGKIFRISYEENPPAAPAPGSGEAAPSEKMDAPQAGARGMESSPYAMKKVMFGKNGRR